MFDTKIGDDGVPFFVAGAILGMLERHFFVTAARFGDITSHLATNHITSPHVKLLHHIASHLSANHITSHATSQHIPSPTPTHHGNTTSHHQNANTIRNGRRVVLTITSISGIALVDRPAHMLWQILSLACSYLCPGLPGSTCNWLSLLDLTIRLIFFSMFQSLGTHLGTCQQQGRPEATGWTMTNFCNTDDNVPILQTPLEFHINLQEMHSETCPDFHTFLLTSARGPCICWRNSEH